MEINELNITEELKKGNNFSFSRFGDGEFACLWGGKGSNADRHQYFPDLGKRLKDVLLSSPEYNIGLQGMVYRQNKERIETFTEENNLKWVKSDILHHWSIKDKEHGKFTEFINALQDKNVLMVAPNRLKQLNLQDKFVEIPDLNCWLSYRETLNEIIEKIEKDMVVLYCASMMSNVIIDDLYKSLGDTITQIDCGSVFEPYIGVATRTYHKNKIKELQ